MHVNVSMMYLCDRLCGLMVRISGYRSRGLGVDSRRYQIFWEVVGLEQGPLNLVSTIEELLERKSNGCGLEIREYADKWQSLGGYSLLADLDHGVQFLV
jgi:hypothetical protein